jgi:hypothetical protein
MRARRNATGLTGASRVRPEWLAIIVAGLAACGGSDASRDAYEVADSAGITIVTSFAPSWGDEPLRIEPVPVLRIGDGGAAPYQFGAIGGAALLPDGRIAVADRQASEVRVFDRDGAHVQTFGRPGEGPGEFRLMGDVRAVAGDSIAVFDQRLRRTVIFSLADGGSRAISNQVEGNYQLFGILGDGKFVLHNPGQGRRSYEGQGLMWDSTDVVVMDPGDGGSRVVARLPSRQLLIGPDGQRESLTPYVGAIQAVADDGFYWATADRYEITLYDADGGVRRILRHSVEPRAVTDSMIAAYEDAFLERVGCDAAPLEPVRAHRRVARRPRRAGAGLHRGRSRRPHPRHLARRAGCSARPAPPPDHAQ